MNSKADCPHAEDGLCKISSQLAGRPVALAADACRACESQATPRAVNRVTCSKAIEALRIAGQLPTPELLDCVNPTKRGVGTELAKMIDKTRALLAFVGLAWIIPEGPQCGCDCKRNELNWRGVRHCRQNISSITLDIYGRWLAHTPAVRYLPWGEQVVKLYLWHATRRAERKERVL